MSNSRNGNQLPRAGRDESKARSILVVEDEQDIAELIALHLEDNHFRVTIAGDGHEGMRQAFAREWDLVILDIKLPGPDGLKICRSLRRDKAYLPVIILTSKSSELDRVLGLELGADDYVTKPFSVSELVARVKAVFRRVDSFEKSLPGAEEPIRIHGLRIEPDSRTVTLHGEPVSLTAREFDLMLHFARHPNHVFSRAQLLDHVWGYGHDGYEHTVNSHINRLRAKIEPDPAHPEIIVTVWGVGYRMPAG